MVFSDTPASGNLGMRQIMALEPDISMRRCTNGAG